MFYIFYRHCENVPISFKSEIVNLKFYKICTIIFLDSICYSAIDSLIRLAFLLNKIHYFFRTKKLDSSFENPPFSREKKTH